MFPGVPCDYNGMKIAFKVDAGSNPYYLAVMVIYQASDGDLSAVEVRQRFRLVPRRPRLPGPRLQWILGCVW